MDWDKGFSAAYYVQTVDPITWRDQDRIEITGGTVSRTDEDLRGSADIDCVNYEQGTERWLRIWLTAKQGSDSARVPLFTGLASSPDKKINGRLVTESVQLYSVLKPAADVLLPRGWYAPAGTEGGVIIKNLLNATPAPVEIEGGSPAITENIVAEDGESNLSMVEKILTAINWRLRIDGNGTIQVCRKAKEHTRRLDALDNDTVEPQIDVEYDWFECPNVFRAVMGDESATAYDDSEDSPLSTINRGREIWLEETSCELNDGESLQGYAERRLKEEQRVSFVAKYSRRYDPDLFVSDLVQLHYPAQEIMGQFYIRSQTIELGYGATTSEEVVNYE